jgi:hypothetical protein
MLLLLVEALGFLFHFADQRSSSLQDQYRHRQRVNRQSLALLPSFTP